MKPHVYIFLLLISFTNGIKGATYYFSTISGDDSRTSLQAQNFTTPWKTLDKLNSFLNNLQPGDSVLFKRGETFSGSVKITVSGSENLPVVFSAYGTGKKPVISGLKNFSGWMQKNKGIWESACTSCGASVNMLLINGSERAMGRYPNSDDPNKGYLVFEAHVDSSKITDKELRSSPNWKDAEVVIRTRRWLLDRNIIKAHSGNSITYAPSSNEEPFNGFGYFIQNHIGTLDKLGEWFYDVKTKMMNVYFGTNDPKKYTIEANVLDTLIYVNNQVNIVVDNLSLIGADESAIRINKGKDIVITNCDIQFSGTDAILVYETNNIIIKSNKIDNTNNNAIQVLACSNAVVRNNIIKNTGLYAGMGKGGNNTYEALRISGNDNIVENNVIDSTGYIPIKFSGSSVLIKNNFIDYFTLTKDDGGGIYTFTPEASKKEVKNRKIIGNIILNGKDASAGVNPPDKPGSVGIYMDDRSGNVEILDNTIADCSHNGIYIHNAHEITVNGNTVFNNNIQLKVRQDKDCEACQVKNNTIDDNILFSKDINQFVSNIESIENNIAGFGTFSDNYYCRPSDDNFIILSSSVTNGKSTAEVYTLQDWQSIYSKDISSKKLPIKIPHYTINNLGKKNKFSNGAFQNNINGLYCNLGSDKCSVTWNNKKMDGGTLQISVSSVPDKLTDAGVRIKVGKVTYGKHYILKFSSIGEENNKTIKIFLAKGKAPFKKLTPVSYCRINGKRTEQEFLLSPHAKYNNTNIVFQVDEQDGTLWLDNVQLYEADISLTDPDDYVRFEYNPTKNIKTISLSDTYFDVQNKMYSGTVTLAPFSSIILIKEFDDKGKLTRKPLTLTEDIE